MARKYRRHYKEHWENGKRLTPWFDGWGNFIGWLDTTNNLSK